MQREHTINHNNVSVTKIYQLHLKYLLNRNWSDDKFIIYYKNMKTSENNCYSKRNILKKKFHKSRT